jgi:hypothetical protein
MTSQTSKNRSGGRRVLAGGALAAGLLMSFGSAAAFAQPATPTPAPGPITGTGANAAQNQPQPGDATAAAAAESQQPTADVLGEVYNEYATGAGGGQVSNWIKEAVQLRAQGFRPSKTNLADIQDALTRRPNQNPLVEALKETVAYQRKIQAQAQNSLPSPNQVVIGGPPLAGQQGSGLVTGPLLPGTSVGGPVG